MRREGLITVESGIIVESAQEDLRHVSLKSNCWTHDRVRACVCAFVTVYVVMFAIEHLLAWRQHGDS